MNNINLIIDGIILLILIAFMVSGAKRGLILSVFKISSSALSAFLAVLIHPFISKLLRATPLFDSIKEFVADRLGLTLGTNAATQAEQARIINDLPIPDFMSRILIENNNSVVNQLLDTHTITDYICGYIANLIMSVIVTTVLLFVIKILIRAFSKTLRLVSKLPVVRQLNYIGGCGIGLFYGILVIWIVFMISMMFITFEWYDAFHSGIDSSVLGKLLYDNNPIRSLLIGDLF